MARAFPRGASSGPPALPRSRPRRALLAGGAALVAAALAGPVLACGVCLEDKVAAVYDHATVTRALAKGRVVVFADVTDSREATLKRVAAAASRTRGVQAASVRTAASPTALSFVLDPGVQAPAQALEAITRDAQVAGVHLVLLKVMS